MAAAEIAVAVGTAVAAGALASPTPWVAQEDRRQFAFDPIPYGLVPALVELFAEGCMYCLTCY